MTADLDPSTIAMIDQTEAAARPHVEGMIEAARKSIEAHGRAAEAVLAFMLDEDKHYPYDVMCALVANFAIREARRAVSDAG